MCTVKPMAVADRPRIALNLPADPTDEDLAREWTLSTADITEVKRCRGDDNRLRFAIQLCVVRNSGRFVGDFAAVPVRIANHLGCQLDLPPALFVAAPVREATDLEHERRIREYLGFRPFDHESRSRLERALAERAAAGALPTELYPLAEEWLHGWQVLLPPTYATNPSFRADRIRYSVSSVRFQKLIRARRLSWNSEAGGMRIKARSGRHSVHQNSRQ